MQAEFDTCKGRAQGQSRGVRHPRVKGNVLHTDPRVLLHAVNMEDSTTVKKKKKRSLGKRQRRDWDWERRVFLCKWKGIIW